MDDTLTLIHKLSNERHELWKLAGHNQITTAQRNRIPRITDELAVLWDRHRRELASERHGNRAAYLNLRKTA